MFSVSCVAQFSKTHYIPPLSSSEQVIPSEQYLYISTPSLTDVNFRIIRIGSSDVTGTVSRDTPYVYLVGNGDNTQLNVKTSSVNEVLSNKGFIIEAEDLIYVTARVIAGEGNHAGEIVSKGLAGLGTDFRIGGYVNTGNPNFAQHNYTFVSILATENNTIVEFSDIKPGVELINNIGAGNTPPPIVLNSGESFVMAVQGPNEENRDGLIGALVHSNKPIVVNCGSFGGTNGEMNNLDLGFDQIVSAERTGTDYIFIKATGQTEVEKILLIAHEDNTNVFLGGSSTSSYTIDAGEYITLNGSNYTSAGNLYVRTSKNVFAFQSIGDNGRDDQANQELFFVPPLSCQTPRVIDNIPQLERIGNREFIGRVTIVTETGSDLNFVINGQSYELDLLPFEIGVVGPIGVSGNNDYVTYILTGLQGNVSIMSTGQLYLASYGSSAAATFGGFYSGFTFKPEVAFDRLDATLDNCLPNVSLSVSPLTAFDVFQWYFNNAPIAGANDNEYTPTQPGYYHVSATISECGTNLISDKIPVSSCATDMDNDGSNDNSDLDIDNDGITNCEESFGTQAINLSNPVSGAITAGTYSNSFTGSFPTPFGTPSATPFTGNADGSFVSETNAGKGYSVIYQMNFAQAANIAMEYVQTALPHDRLNADAEFIVNVPVNKTLTVLNPDDQLLIDTNYDGIYESGITEFSSFEIRFRLNGSNFLAPGSGTFRFQAYQTTSFTYTHKNLSDDDENRSTFRMMATCVPKDTDGDGVPDQNDSDSDNDSVPDFYESQGDTFEPLSNTDDDNDGIDNIFEASTTPADNDLDGVPNFSDLDSDNNGIFDLVESGSNAPDNNADGVIDGSPTSFGTNGYSNGLESGDDSGLLDFLVADTDSDGIFDYLETDNDGDFCNDVREAGFTDTNNDGFLGNSPVTVNSQGVVQASGGYTTPNPLFNIATPIAVTTQPEDRLTCEGQSAAFTVETNAGVTYKWQVSVDGVTFTNITDNTIYSGSDTATLTINSTTPAMDGNQYRVQLNKTGNVCGAVSDAAILSIDSLPPAITRTLVQCDTGSAPDGITVFNLEQATDLITSANPDLSVMYFATMADAVAGNALGSVYTNLSNPQAITVRITDNTSGCFSYSTLNLVANLLPSPTVNVPEQCDIDGIEDGFFVFNLTGSGLPNTTRYFETEMDALLEQNAIVNPTAYTNLVAYEIQTLFARTENSNGCTRIYLVNIKVNPLPNIDANLDLTPHVVCVNEPTFSTVLDAAFLDGSSPADYEYQWSYEGATIPGATSATLTVTNEGLYSVVVTDLNGCSKERFIPVISSSSAVIDDITVVDMIGQNTVTVTLTSDSYGDYVYSLDYPNAFQSSNYFPNVSAGYHIVYVHDLNGCPITSQQIFVMGIPKYFTPNGDGYHDTWNIQGVSEINKNSTIYIFDRYGKLIKQISPWGAGWDGSLNGRPLPGDDYWYSIFLTDGRTYKGHFALKR